MKNEQYKEAVNSLVRHIQDADAIVVGGASGMSAAARFRHYYEHDKDFIDNLGEFEKNMDIVIHLMDFIIGIEPVKNAGHLQREISV